MFAVTGKRKSVSSRIKLASTGVAMFSVMCLVAGCGNKNKSLEPGQSLARVNGQEITVLQVNEELARTNVPAEQQAAVSKQLLESLIDRQLLEGAASIDKVDRDPAVVQAIERAKAQIVAQAYIQRRLVKISRPTKEEIDKYYVDNPDLFSNRRLFNIDQLVFASKDFTEEVKSQIASGKTIDDIAAFMKGRKIENSRGTTVRSSAELPPALLKQLKTMRKGQLFALQNGPSTTIAVLNDIKQDVVALAPAEPQIGNFLMNQRSKEATDAEIARLRASAKIEYLNKQPVETGALNPASQTKTKEKSDDHKSDEHIKRGVADL